MSAESIKAFATRRRAPATKREVILRTAVQLFLDRGYARTTMNDIAQHLSITKPALYHYFRNKEDVLLECYRWGCMLIRESLDEIAARPGSGLEKVSAFIRAYAEVITVDFGRAVIRLDDGELSAAARIEVRSYKREIDRRLRALIQAGIDDESIAPCDPKLASFLIAGALNWTCMWYNPAGHLTADEIAEHFAALLASGLRTPNRQPQLRLVSDKKVKSK